ncbi:hypothetical protein B7L70_03710 [Vulcanisaeta sp. EB80]|jgi:hypothetical protein|uniref:hypothetical protein n=1 Tax=Vulcanisaeta sp. EB80 TaxID=1650660 RepID=UPI00074784C5|nr:hypothetical protein [Vulcanisaeta sp. EB80]KUO81636.1 MAG: hypothetical protein AT714_01875 [Vulcanisaeta sp. OSP_8]KUO86067.1 MAG: hypothetical protein AT716_04290 [Vulcanisaeta sp. MG_3]KUO94472.1 MAG: hypothetical protein AT717_06835 [Vulcanisaeta sp. CIS_19]MCG2864391.1 hypothetical protein [Vulcanisaeta sp.]MCG2866644.1 hypothetical protein [Vulcanisaeta sp.]
MYRLFTYMALVRYVEFVLIVLDLAYLGILNPLNKFLIAILMTAIVYSLLAVSSYSLTTNILITLLLVLAITGTDVALLVLVIMTPTIPSIGLYTAFFINVILDVLVIVLNIELIRR